ncbi:hypothetical protein [Cohnella sp.]|uniref:hypothetical protein n=1 Tax=Cohnella sp. TaxID=1883426 RepID=UPI0035667F6F
MAVERTRLATGDQGVHAVFYPIEGDLRRINHEVFRPSGQLVVLDTGQAAAQVYNELANPWNII